MKLLHIDSSILGQNSASRELSAAWVANWQQQHRHGEIRHVDLARQPLAHLSGEVFGARSAPETLRDADLQRGIDADRESQATLRPAGQGDSRPFASITELISLPGKDRSTPGGIEFASSASALPFL